MAFQSDKSVGAPLVGAPSFDVSSSRDPSIPSDAPLDYWRSRSPADEHSILEIRRSLAGHLHKVFPEMADASLGDLSTAILNGFPIAETFDLGGHTWLLDPADRLAEACRFSLLWLAAVEGSPISLSLLCRMIEFSPSFAGSEGMIDRISAHNAVAAAAAHWASSVKITLLEVEKPTDVIEILDDSIERYLQDRDVGEFVPLQDHEVITQTVQSELPLVFATRKGLEDAEGSLSSRFPWLADAAKSLLQSQYLALAGNSALRFPPTLLVGPSGTAKTSFAHALAEAVGLPTYYVSAAGKTGALEIIGSSKTYANATTSVGVKAMATRRCRNPLIIVDEVEKFGESRHNGDPYGALATMIEAHTARAYMDDFLESHVDLSMISWIFTANSTDAMQGAFMDRVEILRVSRPTTEHFPAIYRNLLRDIAEENSIPVDRLPVLSSPVIRAIKESFREGVSLRRVRGAIAKSLQIAARHSDKH